ncbi:MAG: hypothetical protein WBO48_15950 [Candidatus Promineifilaceae bacterium]
MVKKRLRFEWLTAVLGLLLLLFMGGAQSVYAEGIVFGELVAAGDEIEGDVVLNGNDVRLAGVVDGDAFIIGQTVIIDGDVNGSLFVIGNNVVINGQIGGSVYVGSVSTQVGGTAVIGRSLYNAGLSLLTERGSTVGRDLFAVTFSARLAGNVERNTQAVIGIVEVVRFVLNSINRVTTGQSVSFLEPGLTIDTRNKSTMYRVRAQAEEINPQMVAAGNWAADRGRLLVSYLVVGVLALWLLPNWLQKWSGQAGKRPLPALGSGLGAYIFGFIGSLIALIVLIALGAGLAMVTFWGLAFTWWGISLSLLSLFFWIFILFVSYLSKVIVAYRFGGWFLGRFMPRAQRRVWSLLFGLVVFVLLAAIPYAGWALSLIVTFIGLGAVVVAFFVDQQNRRAGETAVTAAK